MEQLRDLSLGDATRQQRGAFWKRMLRPREATLGERADNADALIAETRSLRRRFLLQFYGDGSGDRYETETATETAVLLRSLHSRGEL